MFKILGLLLLSVSCSHGYSYGPPMSVCNHMTPSHGPQPQSSTPPYTVTVSSATYQRGQNITVTIRATNSNSPFKGFMLQARQPGSSTAIGQFYLMNGDSKLMSCSGGTSNTVSHNSPVPKTINQVTWTTQTGGSVNFRATFVQVKSTYWTGVESITLTEATTTSTTTTTTTTTIPTTTSTTTTTTTTPTTTSTTTTTTTPTTTSTTTSTTTPTTTSTTTTTPTTTTSTTTTTTTPTTTADASTSASSETDSDESTSSNESNSSEEDNTTSTTPKTATNKPPSVNDGASTPSSATLAGAHSVWSVIGLLVGWTLVLV